MSGTDCEAIRGILVDLKIGGEPSLFIMVDGDGTINRMGSGRVGEVERDLFIGKTDEGVFLGLRSRITPELLDWCGKSLADPRRKGKECNLVVGFRDDAGGEWMTNWTYGAESLGPPPPVREYVLAALQATTPWYEAQKAMVSRQK